MSWFPAEVCRGSGTRGAQARGRGLQGDDVIHGQDQGGGGFATPSPRAPRIRSQPPGGALGARTGASLVTALGLRARRSRRTRPAPRRAGRKGHGAPGAEGSGSSRVLASPAHTHPGSPARARDVTRGRGADLLFGTQTLPLRGRGQGLPFVAVCRLLLAVASLVADPRSRRPRPVVGRWRGGDQPWPPPAADAAAADSRIGFMLSLWQSAHS